MTVNKRTLLELEEEELRADLDDGFISRSEFERRLKELKKNYNTNDTCPQCGLSKGKHKMDCSNVS
jgi:hypothetical protein